MTVHGGDVLRAILVVGAVVAAAGDRRTGRIPNVLVVPLLLVTAVLAMWSPASGLAALAMGLPYLTGYGLRAVGGGDVKLAPACGAMLGSVELVPVVLVLAAAATVVHAALLRQPTIRHGPALVGSTLFVTLLAQFPS